MMTDKLVGSAGRVKPAQRSQAQRDLERYANRWSVDYERSSAHSFRSRQMRASILDN